MNMKLNAQREIEAKALDVELLDEDEQEEEILGGGSTLVRGASTADNGELQLNQQRDVEPDDYDAGTDAHSDRVRGAGDQSLDDLALTLGQGLGLQSHIGGLRHDRPEPNVNDPETH